MFKYSSNLILFFPGEFVSKLTRELEWDIR